MVADHAHAVILWCNKHLNGDFAYGSTVFSPLSHAVSHACCYHTHDRQITHLKTDKIVDPISHAWIHCLRPSGGTPVFVTEFSYLYIIKYRTGL